MGTNWQPLLAQTGRAKYRALVDSINKGIAEGALEAGQKLPPVRELAFRLNITPGTVARAYSILIEDGTLTAGVGRGTYVAETKATIVDDNTGGMSDFFSPRIPDMGKTGFVREALKQIA